MGHTEPVGQETKIEMRNIRDSTQPAAEGKCWNGRCVKKVFYVSAAVELFAAVCTGVPGAIYQSNAAMYSAVGLGIASFITLIVTLSSGDSHPDAAVG